MTCTIKKHLSAEALIRSVFHEFQKIPDPQKATRACSISFLDILMSGLAVFDLKFPSLLQYDKQRRAKADNLKTLYHINQSPSDTYLRERLDELDPKFLRPAFTKLFSALQRGKHLESYVFFQGKYLLALDGTGQFSSDKVCCPHCCTKHHKNGSVSYYHQMLGACIVHPDQRNPIPLCPEPIQNGDGSEKNDCERNAAKRFIEHFKREHPHLKVIVVSDGSSSNAPYINLLAANKMDYILGAKPGDHVFLFETLHNSERACYHEFTDAEGYLHQFQYLNQTPLNKSNPDVLTNVVEYMQTDRKGKEIKFSWITNILLTEETLFPVMRGGRARWKIENETFNTLKNLGPNFEHNYGHGKKYLATVLCLLMMLVFLMDQVKEIACTLFKAAKVRAGSYRAFWEEIRVLFKFASIPSWEWLYQVIEKNQRLNTS
jgi:hypothetical protein